jgi:hypothetical protein
VPNAAELAAEPSAIPRLSFVETRLLVDREGSDSVAAVSPVAGVTDGSRPVVSVGAIELGAVLCDGARVLVDAVRVGAIVATAPVVSVALELFELVVPPGLEPTLLEHANEQQTATMLALPFRCMTVAIVPTARSRGATILSPAHGKLWRASVCHANAASP